MATNAQNRPKFPVATGIWLVALIWLAALIIVRPWGNFPLNDDWSFGRTVKHFVEHHEFAPCSWAAMPLVTNTFWGAIFCLPSGFSFDALRISTLVAALLGMFAVYTLVKMSRAPEWLAVMTALVLGFNPIFFPLSYTFMTDVLFITVCVLASIFLLRNLLAGNNSDLFIGTALVVLGILSRQLALAVPLAFAIVSCLKRGLRPRELWRALFPAAIGIVVFIVFQRWMAVTGRLSAMTGQKNSELSHALLHPLESFPHLMNNVYISLFYLGLFLLPVSLCVLASVWAAQKKKVQILFAISLWVLLLAYFFFQRDAGPMPLSSGVLTRSGVGPATLRDAFFLDLNARPDLPVVFWKTVTVLSAMGATALMTLIGLFIVETAPKLRSATMTDNQVMALFLLFIGAIYLAPILLTTLFDRYLIFAIPFLAAALVAAFPPLPKLSARIFVPAMAILTAFVLFSVCTTRDYLTWNRARWAVTNDLLAREHLDAGKMELDGGFEFNGLNFYERKDWWRVKDPAYIISFGPVPGYASIEEHQYSQWLPAGTGKVMALKKTADQATAKN
jgi:hypothetical protein